jgi:hypothetical protein
MLASGALVSWPHAATNTRTGRCFLIMAERTATAVPRDRNAEVPRAIATLRAYRHLDVPASVAFRGSLWWIAASRSQI